MRWPHPAASPPTVSRQLPPCSRPRPRPRAQLERTHEIPDVSVCFDARASQTAGSAAPRSAAPTGPMKTATPASAPGPLAATTVLVATTATAALPVRQNVHRLLFHARHAHLTVTLPPCTSPSPPSLFSARSDPDGLPSNSSVWLALADHRLAVHQLDVPRGRRVRRGLRQRQPAGRRHRRPRVQLNRSTTTQVYTSPLKAVVPPPLPARVVRRGSMRNPAGCNPLHPSPPPACRLCKTR